MRLYVTDLDGTFLRSDASLSDYSVNTLNRLLSEGVNFTYATARSFASAAPLVKGLVLTCPAVTFNGVFVINPISGEHIIENTYSPQALATAKEFLESGNYAPLVYSYIDGKERVSFLANRANEVKGYLDSRKGDKRLRACRNYKELFEGNIFYFTVINANDYAPLDSVFTAENGFSRNIQQDTYDDTVWYEIYDKSAGKVNAVLQVKELLGADELICFGDNFNDMQMIEAAELGIAVSNACPELKTAADIVIESNDNDAVVNFISSRETNGKNSFEAAVEKACSRSKGFHGSVGTQNEKLIHATLKNYYAPHSDEQEIKIGNYFADAVGENGIYEIQSAGLYRLKDKLRAFSASTRVNVVYPFIGEYSTLYINSESGEVVRQTPSRKVNPKLKIFEELYSIKEFLSDENITIILAKLKVEKRVYFRGNEIPDLRNKYNRRKCLIEKVPIELMEEITLHSQEDYLRWLPDNLPESFTKKEFCTVAKEPGSSLRLEVLRSVGLLIATGKKGNAFVYTKKEHNNG